MFKSYNTNTYKLIINEQIKIQSLYIWKYKFNKKWNLPIIYEESILYESFIIENYF